MTRSTSKASYNEIKEDGTEMSQSDKILEIISIGGDWSLQEIMEAYRAKWSNIELSSVSARVNILKDPDNPKIIEASPRKCSITNKTINPLTTNKCTHERYKTKEYMMQSNALKRKHGNENEKIRIGNIVDNCEDCGADIGHAKRVKVEVIKNPVIKYNIIVRGKKSSMICYDGETIEEAEKICRLKFGKHFEEISE